MRNPRQLWSSLACVAGMLTAACATGCAAGCTGEPVRELTAHAGSSGHAIAYAGTEVASARSAAGSAATGVAHLRGSEIVDAPAPACDEPALHFHGGELRGPVCPEEARARGLTVVDLSDTWTPTVLGPGPLYQPPPAAPVLGGTGDSTAGGAAISAARGGEDPPADAPPAPRAPGEQLAPPGPAVAEDRPEPVIDTPDYRAVYIALASERFDQAGSDGEIAVRDRYLELYGIFPTLPVLRARLGDDARHACHAGVDHGALPSLSGIYWEEKPSRGLWRKRQARQLRAALEHQRRRRELDSLDALAQVNGYYRRTVARLQQLEAEIAAFTAMEAHLACDGLLDQGRVDGVFDWRTGDALGAFQRRHFVVARGQMDEDTRAALVTDSRELDLRQALRVLRERVVAATGILADGSARNQPAPILGRRLDPPAMYAVHGHEPLPNGAPDLVGPATEAAARHLGWTDFHGVRRFLDAHAAAAASRLHVALALPPVPDYYDAHMELRVEIDRGDVWYDPIPRWRKVERGPALTVFAAVGDREIALVRWQTTIGGWQDERLPGGAVVSRYKNSEVGPRVWRDLYAAPAWFPPRSTPDDDLLRRQWNGRYTVKRDVLGPGYRSAYGLAMFIHHMVVRVGDGQRLDDHGIRTHGSANYPSIVRGVSHGCHRLFNHQALRLASFALERREHRRHGAERRMYQRVIYKGGRKVIDLRSRGYRYELVPPIPVEVTEGRIRSRRKVPPR